MGWSCRADAAKTLDAWTAFCVKQTGSQNTYKADGINYFFEHSSVEHDDGAITGSTWRMANVTWHRVGGFRINGDGTIRLAPRGLLKAMQGAAHKTPERISPVGCCI